MRPVHYSFLSIIVGRKLGPVRSGIVVPHPYTDGTVECKEDLNASLSLHVLECILLKSVSGPEQFGTAVLVGLSARRS